MVSIRATHPHISLQTIYTKFLVYQFFMHIPTFPLNRSSILPVLVRRALLTVPSISTSRTNLFTRFRILHSIGFCILSSFICFSGRTHRMDLYQQFQNRGADKFPLPPYLFSLSWLSTFSPQHSSKIFRQILSILHLFLYPRNPGERKLQIQLHFP